MTGLTVPALERQVLLAHVTGKSRAWVLAHPEAPLTPEQQAAFESAARQFQAGVRSPTFSATGSSSVWISGLARRPISARRRRLLIETALAWARTHPRSRPLTVS